MNTISPSTNWNPSPLQESIIPPILTINEKYNPEIAVKAEAFHKSIISAKELVQTNIPPREQITSPFFCVRDLGFIFGVRGEGKSWIAMMMARAIASSDSLHSWEVTKARRVLFVDVRCLSNQSKSDKKHWEIRLCSSTSCSTKCFMTEHARAWI